MDKQLLKKLIEKELTQADIVRELKCSQTNVRYWLKKHNLKPHVKLASKRSRKKRTTVCGYCGTEFLKEVRTIQTNKMLGHKNYCCKKCQNKAKEKFVFVKCANCGKKIKKTPAELRASKSGRSFCNRHCASIVNNSVYKSGKNSGNYKDGRASYRYRALAYYNSKCSVCGYNIEKVLQVHHRDKDRKNNSVENLDVLCPTCHKEYHVGIRNY